MCLRQLLVSEITELILWEPHWSRYQKSTRAHVLVLSGNAQKCEIITSCDTAAGFNVDGAGGLWKATLLQRVRLMAVRGRGQIENTPTSACLIAAV